MIADIRDSERCSAVILDPGDPEDNVLLENLRADARIEVIDNFHEQRAGLHRLRPTPHPELTAEPVRWAYYPWRRTVVSILGPRAFRLMRLDRNRNLITVDEQERLGRLRVGVIGLSVGHVIAHTLAAQGLCGELRLSDFDHLELPNLNRVPATVLDHGVNKAVLAARRIAELDPYLTVGVHQAGITADSIAEFLDGLDIVVEECDSLDAKVLVRESARARRLPVLMTTSDRGLLDVERFDLEPSRPILHGLLGDLDTAQLSGLSNEDKVPYVLRIIDAAGLSPRMAASLIEVGTTLSTWPQLAGEVALGATVVAEAIRRIGLGQALPSGRVRIDAAAMLDELADPLATTHDSPPTDPWTEPTEPTEPSDIVAAAAIRAPSGGNAQPWHVEVQKDSVSLRLAPEYTTTMDVGYRGSAVALGAAVFNARIAAAAHGFVGQVEFQPGDEGSPLRAMVRLAPGDDQALAQWYEPMLRRETNRHFGAPAPIRADTLELLHSTARREGARLHMLRTAAEINRAAEILAAADRIRYLTPRLHAEMFSELRWPGGRSPETGIDVLSLELDPADLVILDILRRPEVMANLARWNAGAALGDGTHDRVAASAAIGVITVHGQTLTDYAHAGSAIEAVWIAAQQHGLAVQPVSPVFLYAHDDPDLRELSPAFAEDLADLQYNFRELVRTGPDESQALVLRFSFAPRPSVRSRRRGLRSASPPR